MAEYSDKEILRIFNINPSKGFDLLVRKYQKRLYWHIRKMVIEHEDTNDVLQNVFIKVWKSLGKFREDSALFTWLYRIATNDCLTFLKKKKTRLYLPIESVEQRLINMPDDNSLYSGDDIQHKLQKAILTLPDKQRLVFNMRYFDEMKYKDMANILKTSTGALKASYHHAVKKIERFIEED
mgnify:CR=1 FL=1